VRYAPSAEFRLVAACCAWPRSSKRSKEISAAAAAGIDWPHLLQVVDRHRVWGLVHDGLTVAGVALPAEAARMLSAAAEEVTRQNLRLAAEALNVQRSFAAERIPVVFLKGTALSLMAYRNLNVKMSFDIDVLVPPASVKDACRVLRADGFVRVAPAGDAEDDRFDGWIATASEATFRQATRGTLVDLHWHVADDRALSRRFTLWSANHSVEVSPDAQLCTLGDDDLFAFLCLHGAHHAWSRLKWLADLHAWVATKTPDEIARLYRAAMERGATRAAGQALWLCRTIFGLELPPPIANDLAADAAVNWLAQIALGAMGCDGRVAETQDRALGGLGILMSQFLLSPGPRNWFAVVRAHSIGYADYQRFALPRSFFFLYPVLRAPSWVWRHSKRLLANR